MILEDYEALKCRYPSKKCWNQRAVKRNGERHNLCEMHRQKANNNQRRLDKKRKAGHMLKGSEPGSGTSEIEVPEYDYRTQVPAAAVAALQHQQQQQHALHPLAHLPLGHQLPHAYHGVSVSAAAPHARLHPHAHALAHHALSPLAQQQVLAHHYHQQQEKRLRLSLSSMYAAAQALSPHGAGAAVAPQSRSPPSSVPAPLAAPAVPLAPLRPGSVPSLASSSAAPRSVLHLPPLTAHIPALAKSVSPPRSSSPSSVSVPVALSRSASASSSPPSLGSSKPTILLPPLTSVPRCSQAPFQLPLASAGAGVPSWSSGLRSEEKANS